MSSFRPPVRLHLFTLAFTGEQTGLEAAFQTNYFVRNLRTIRWALISGLCAYSAFGALDAFMFAEAYGPLWLLRFGVVCPVILVALLLTWWPGFGRVWQPVLAAAVAVSGAAIVVMTVVAPPPYNYTYYAGLILVLVFGYTVSRLRFLWATLVGWLIVVLYEAAACWLVETPTAVLVGNSFFFICTNVLGMIACYSGEYHARRSHWLLHLLEVERERVQASHRELTEKIEELGREREQVRVLQGLIPICAHCKRIRDDKGYWNQLESYIRAHSHAEFSHGICPECTEKYYGEYLK